MAQTDSLRLPTAGTAVHREECTSCFDSQDDELGVDVCLSCFNGQCPAGSRNQHALLHAAKTGHSLALNIRRRRRPQPQSKRDSQEPPMKKVAIQEEPSDQEKYDFTTTPVRYEGGGAQTVATDDKITALSEAILSSMSSAKKFEVKSWEEEITACEHTLCLEQDVAAAGGHDISQCSDPSCSLTSNLWLCLTCGTANCGRKQFGGGGGNGHALEHFASTKHAVSVKLGTIEPDGSADVFCYACDDAKIDPEVGTHLRGVGIEVETQTKTEKSMTELQLEQNLKFDFAMTGEDGKDLQPLAGPGLTGLKNLGNSCYIASTLQALFALAPFQQRYLEAFAEHPHICDKISPAECTECQISKVADGLLSGQYARVEAHADDASGKRFQVGIRPMMFKSLIGKGHSEFSTMRQQDADEFIRHLLKTMAKDAKALRKTDPASTFAFETETRLQCTKCLKVRYRREAQDIASVPVTAVELPRTDDGPLQYETVSMRSCFDLMTAAGDLEYNCPTCREQVVASQTTKFATFPERLIVQARRFQLVNWVPQKMNVPIADGTSEIELDTYLGKGLAKNEEELPDDAQEAAPTPPVDEETLVQLISMGFPEYHCRKALIETGNNGAEVATAWLFENPDAGASEEPMADAASDGAVANLTAMGFTEAQSKRALKATGGDPERAVDWLFSHADEAGDDGEDSGDSAAPAARGSASLPAKYRLKAFISHKGPSVHSGHYVAHVKKADPTGWVLFNDEKVVDANGGEQGAGKLMPYAYVYIYERI